MGNLVTRINKKERLSVKQQVAIALLKGHRAFDDYRRQNNSGHITRIAYQLLNRQIGIEIETSASDHYLSKITSLMTKKTMERPVIINNGSKYLYNSSKLQKAVSNRGAIDNYIYDDGIMETTLRFDLKSLKALKYVLKTLNKYSEKHNKIKKRSAYSGDRGSIHLHIDVPDVNFYNLNPYMLQERVGLSNINLFRSFFDRNSLGRDDAFIGGGRNISPDKEKETFEYRLGYLTYSYVRVIKWCIMCQEMTNFLTRKKSNLDMKFLRWLHEVEV